MISTGNKRLLTLQQKQKQKQKNLLYKIVCVLNKTLTRTRTEDIYLPKPSSHFQFITGNLSQVGTPGQSSPKCHLPHGAKLCPCLTCNVTGYTSMTQRMSGHVTPAPLSFSVVFLLLFVHTSTCTCIFLGIPVDAIISYCKAPPQTTRKRYKRK